MEGESLGLCSGPAGFVSKVALFVTFKPFHLDHLTFQFFI